MALSIVFAGTPTFALPALDALLQSPHPIMGVYTQPDRPAGRGQKITASPVKIRAKNAGIPCFQPLSLKDPTEHAHLKSLSPDIMVVVAYGLLLPKAILTLPRYGCINIHASLLPRWRGAAPIQHAILAGDAKTGVTLMQMDEGLDSGDILLQQSCDILPTDTSGDIHERLSHLGAHLLLETLNAIESNTVSRQPQNKANVTLAPKILKSMAKLNWTDSAENIVRHIRAFNPAPIAFTFFDNQLLRIWEAHVSSEKTTATPGTVLRVDDKGLWVATGEGVVQLHHIQLAGKRVQLASDFNAPKSLLFSPGKTCFE